MRRPTIADLAQAAGVSISTINRILGGSTPVKGTTIQRVQAAAEQIGFYGLGTIEKRMRETAPSFRLGFLLQQSRRELYQLFGREIIAACRRRRDEIVDPLVDFVDILTPENIAERLLVLGQDCDAVAVIAADHPLTGQAIHTLRGQGTPVVTYITDNSAPERAAYVGADNWKLGRTAAWLITQMAPPKGRVAVFIGNHRYQCQDIADASIRSYIREHAPLLTVDESRPTNEEAKTAYRLIRDLLNSADDLIGILILGGGISGVLKALREAPATHRAHIRLICRDIGPETRKGLSEGLITAALCHPLQATSNMLVETMLEVASQKTAIATLHRTIPFEIITPENL